MDGQKILTGVLMDEHFEISFIEVCESCNISQDYLIALIEHGFFDDVSHPFEDMVFNHQMIERVKTAERLQRELDVNLQGVILAMELMHELEVVKRQLNVLKRSVSL